MYITPPTFMRELKLDKTVSGDFGMAFGDTHDDASTKGTSSSLGPQALQSSQRPNTGQRIWFQNPITAAGWTPVDACDYNFAL
jgi:hypothetical protein